MSTCLYDQHVRQGLTLGPPFCQRGSRCIAVQWVAVTRVGDPAVSNCARSSSHLVPETACSCPLRMLYDYQDVDPKQYQVLSRHTKEENSRTILMTPSHRLLLIPLILTPRCCWIQPCWESRASCVEVEACEWYLLRSRYLEMEVPTRICGVSRRLLARCWLELGRSRMIRRPLPCIAPTVRCPYLL